MKGTHRLSRRTFLGRVVGGAAFGGSAYLLVLGTAGAHPTENRDTSDRGRSHRRAGRRADPSPGPGAGPQADIRDRNTCDHQSGDRDPYDVVSCPRRRPRRRG